MSADRRIGSVLGGRYRIDEVVGRGGTGVVYRATHLLTGRVVAIKMLHHGVIDGRRSQQRFVLEARAIAHLNHPHVVQVLDMGLEEGSAYLVLELLRGESLAAILEREGRLPRARLLPLLLPVMDALEEAHAAGIVHRDLKPENIVVAIDRRGRETAKVIDFGIAKVGSSLTRTLEPVTMPGTVMGTPAYMSPEQITGAPVGPASDVWSMGVILYECLTGWLPFDRATAVAMVSAITTGEHVHLCEYLGQSSSIAAAVEGALTVDPVLRHHSMAAFVEALTTHLAQEEEDEPITLPGGLRRKEGDPTLVDAEIADDDETNVA